MNPVVRLLLAAWAAAMVAACGGVQRERASAREDANAGADASAGADATPPDGEAVIDPGAFGPTTPEGDPIEPYCEPNPPSRPPRCPVAGPAPGGPCSDPGLRCVYPDDAGDYSLASDTCIDDDGGPFWTSSVVVCGYDCAAERDAGTTPVSTAVPCAARPPVECAPRWFETRQNVLDGELQAIADGCGAGSEYSYVVLFDSNGCAVSLGGTTNPATACVAGSLAKARFACALGHPCGQAVRSLVQ